MIINIHAGHNPDGMVAFGAVGLIRESTEARAIKDRAITKLTAMGHTVYDCTCNDGVSQQDVLNRIVAACNAHKADLDVSIHLNAGAQSVADGKTTGTEVYVYSDSSAALPFAQQVCEQISNIGYRNRGVKVRPSLFFLGHTAAPAMLIECCFVDDPEDIGLYNADQMAAAIVAGITGQTVQQPTNDAVQLASMSKEQFVEWIGALAHVDMKTSGILASVTTAQAILESGYGKSELALNALNLGGMKAKLSGNTWDSEWDGTIYQKETAEQREDGSYYTIMADFRVYPSVTAYLRDHSDYLSGARKGNELRYAGVIGCKDYRRAFQIIKDGDYATSHNYVDNLCRVVEQWRLTRFDAVAPMQNYIYAVSVADVWTQHEAEIAAAGLPAGMGYKIHKIPIG